MFENRAALVGARGERLGPSQWIVIDQARINLFADATGDRNWIHVNEARAAKGRYEGTIAHGHLTLAMAPVLAALEYVSMQPLSTRKLRMIMRKFP
jgi:acyl dehydratase